MKLFKIGLLLLLGAAMPVIGFAQQVTWDVSLWGKRRAFTEHVEKLAELVAHKTNGEFTLRLSYGGLSKPRENLNGIAAGAFEMAQFCAGYHEEKNPSITVMELPFLGVSTLSQERAISQWLYRHPSVLQDFRRWNAIALMPSPLPQYNLIGVGQKPVTLRQLAGLNVRATGGIGRAMEALGAAPKSIVATEVRGALETGDISAVAFAPHAHMSFGTLANAAWWTTNLNPGTVHCPVVANIDAVGRLSKAHRDALYGSINEALDYYIAHYRYNMRESWEPALSQLGVEKVTFDQREISDFRERVEQPAALAWIDRHERNGLPAREIYTLVKVALTGENPEEFLLSGNLPEQVEWASTAVNNQQAKKEEILAAFSFDKKNATAPASTPNMTDSALLQPVAKAQPVELRQPLAQEPALAAVDVAALQSRPGVIQGGIPALFVNDNSSQSQTNMNTMGNVSAPGSGTGAYFGFPRKGNSSPYNADPLAMLVEWELTGDATVGSTIAELSDFIGYQVLTDDSTAINVYERKLPRAQHHISEISVGDAFQMLSGRGLVTVFDHTDRTVKHVPLKTQRASNLPPCPADLDVGVRTGDGVLLLPDGRRCAY